MMLNLWIGTAIGSIPLVGDLFDVGWKANTRNVALMERGMTNPEAAKRSSLRALIGLGLISAVALGAIIGLVFWLAASIGKPK